MASIHKIKLTEGEAVLKCYINLSAGGTIDIDPTAYYLTRPNEVYDPVNSKITIKALYWGSKAGKQIDITRVVPTSPQFEGDVEWDVSGIHSHYYLIDAGFYEYKGFVDNTYAGKPIRIIGDGPFHVIMVLGKSGWQNKIEPWQFGQYDDPNVVGA
jgi:hypothetical protein